MKTFVQTWFDYNFLWTVIEDNSDQEDEITIGIVSDSHPHGDQQLVGYNDIIRTVTEEGDEEEEMGIAVRKLQPPHGDRQLVSYPYKDTDREPCNSKQQPIHDEDFHC